MGKETAEKLTLTGLRDLINERDRRYNGLFEAQKEALTNAVSSINRQTEAAFHAAQIAIDKSEAAQKQYNEEHNSLSRRMVALDRYDSDKKSIEDKFDDIKKAIGDIQVSLGIGTGEKAQVKVNRATGQWLVVVAVAVVGIISNVVMFLIVHGKVP